MQTAEKIEAQTGDELKLLHKSLGDSFNTQPRLGDAREASRDTL
jgi:hypothetical protein